MKHAFQLYAKFEKEIPDLSIESLRRLVKARTGRPELNVTKVYFVSPFGSRSGMAQRFRSDRVFLAGDAAHVHPPAGGQGMNTSVQDAYNLGWKLGHVLRHGAAPSLLDTYEEERLPVAANLLEFVGQMHKDWLGKTKDKEEPRKGEHMQLGLNYRGGPLSADERHDVPDHVTRAGDRAPDAPLVNASQAPLRLFDLFRGPHFTLLALGGAPLPSLGGRCAEAMRTYRIVRAGEGGPADDAVLVDKGGHAHRNYGEGLILIRPDGYLGYAGPYDGASGLNRYLGRFFG
jgi:hypothetical protein